MGQSDGPRALPSQCSSPTPPHRNSPLRARRAHPRHRRSCGSRPPLRRRRPARHAHAHSAGSRAAQGAAICCAALGSRQIRVSWLRVTWSVESKQRGGGRRRPAAAAATAASGTLPAATLPARRLFGRVSVPLAHHPPRRPSSRRRFYFYARALPGTAATERAAPAGRCTRGARGRRPGSLQLGWTGTRTPGALTFGAR